MSNNSLDSSDSENDNLIKPKNNFNIFIGCPNECQRNYSVITPRNNYSILHKINENTLLVKMTYRQLIHYTSNWIYNRTIDYNKVEELFKELEKTTDYYKIGWTLHAFKDISTNNIKLLDGQHRREAIKLYLDKYDINMNDNNEIILWIYLFENEIDNEEQIIELFKNINNNKSFDEKELPSKRKIELIKLLKLHHILSKGIKLDPRRNTSHSPYIHIKEFKGIIDKILEYYSHLTNEMIINRLQYINHRISLLTTEENWNSLFGKREISDKRLEIINKCHNIKFYLNIKDSKYNYNEWIKYFNDTDKII